MDDQEYPIMKLHSQKGRLYYYHGNFYHPLELKGANIGLVKRAIREFTKANQQMVERDRASPQYKTLLQIFDEQFSQQAN